MRPARVAIAHQTLCFASGTGGVSQSKQMSRRSRGAICLRIDLAAWHTPTPSHVLTPRLRRHAHKQRDATANCVFLNLQKLCRMIKHSFNLEILNLE